MAPDALKDLAVELPAALEPIARLALNLRWVWNHASDRVWEALAPEVWYQTRNPLLVIQNTPRSRLEELARNDEFVERVRRLDRAQAEYLGRPSWFQQSSALERPLGIDTREAMGASPCRAATLEWASHGVLMVFAGALGVTIAWLATARLLRRGSPLRAGPASAWNALSELREGVIATDGEGRVVFMNRVAEALTGWKSADAAGEPLHAGYRIIDEHSRAPIDYLARSEAAAKEPTDPARAAVRLVRRDGQETSVHDSFSRLREAGAGEAGYAVVFHDISQLRAMAQQLSWQASHDSLTGLVNRRELERRLAHLLDASHGQGRQHVLLYIDLDNFKVVNDSCGHAAGDELLRSLTSLMATKIRGSHTDVARLSETGVVLSDGSERPADHVVYATGFGSMNGWAAQLIGQDVADRVGKCWGLGSGTAKDPGPWEGELRNMWKPTRQAALWFHGGNLAQARFYSLILALQLKARQIGLPTPVYGMPPVHHLQ